LVPALLRLADGDMQELHLPPWQQSFALVGLVSLISILPILLQLLNYLRRAEVVASLRDCVPRRRRLLFEKRRAS
jgi:hypothetical protein